MLLHFFPHLFLFLSDFLVPSRPRHYFRLAPSTATPAQGRFIFSPRERTQQYLKESQGFRSALLEPEVCTG